MADFDIVIIGGGPAGYVAALHAAQLGAKVALIEKDSLGGTCLNRGCIPTKTYLETAHRVRIIHEAGEFGIKTSDAELDIDVIRSRKNGIVNGLRGGIEGLLASRGVEIIQGKGSLKSVGKVIVNGSKTIEAGKIIFATGSSSLVPDLFYEAGDKILDAECALNLEEIPKRLMVVGGGMVGVEMATIYQAFGSEVTLVEKLPNLLPTEEKAASEIVRASLELQGVKILTGVGVKAVSPTVNGISTTLEDGSSHDAEKLLVAVGRTPNTDGLGLDSAGVKMSGKFVAVDETMQTSLKGVYAVGDLTGQPMLAHVASAEGIVAASNIMGEPLRMHYETTPYCAYTSPEVARVGITEVEARGNGANITVGEFPASYSGRARSLGATDGFVKVIADGDTMEILGATIVGENASEIIHELALAMRNELTLECIAETIHAHPTLSEMVAEACLNAMGKPLHGV